MTDRYIIYDPEDGWQEAGSRKEADSAWDTTVEDYRDQGGDGWHEDVESLGLFRLVPVTTVRLERTATADDDTEQGQRCRDCGWDFFAELVEVQEPDALAVLEAERDELLERAERAEAGLDEANHIVADLRAERAALRAELDRWAGADVATPLAERLSGLIESYNDEMESLHGLVDRAAAARDELRLTLLAEQGDPNHPGRMALDRIAAACGCAEWDYPAQVERDVLAVVAERDELRAAMWAVERALRDPTPPKRRTN